jgi:HlyD family secretion protein
MKKNLVIAVIVSVIVATAYYLISQNNGVDESGFAKGNGRIEATQIHISAQNGGTLIELNADEGDFIKKGDVLAKIDSKELQASLQGALAQVEQATKAKESAQAQMRQLQSELELARHEQNISISEYEKYKTKYDATQAAFEAVQSKVDQTDAAIKAANAQVAQIQTKIDDNTLIAPTNARVLYTLARRGELVHAAQRVATLLDLTDTYMNIFLPTKEAGLAHVGTPARIVLDALAHISIPASVTYVSPQAQFTPKQIETQAEREKLMFKVKVSIDEDVLKQHLQKVRTGLPGVAYVRLDPTKPWPKSVPKLYNEQ